ncbi:MAG: hypothetical protein FWD63_09845, partial [Propionibacteriaceae bacterium]|nr:hypothetical protein [Propionibacteriaceae bacterium]
SNTCSIIDDVLLPQTAASPSQATIIARLREQVGAMEGRRSELVCPAPPVLAPLLPGGGWKPGCAYDVSSMALLASLLAVPSREGSWCAVVGLPEQGVEAAALAGVNLDRLVLVPDPGQRWLSVVASLSGAMPVVAVRPPERVREADAARLAARLREHQSVLFTLGGWPGAEAAITLDETNWAGLGTGWGYLTGRGANLQVASKRWPRARSVRIRLPGADGALEAASTQVAESIDELWQVAV